MRPFSAEPSAGRPDRCGSSLRMGKRHLDGAGVEPCGPLGTRGLGRVEDVEVAHGVAMVFPLPYQPSVLARHRRHTP